MIRLSPQARALYHREMAAAKAAASTEQRWRHLERTHIISQPSPLLHTINHFAMFKLALREHDRREALGQLIRVVVAGPGSLTGRCPQGNTGRVDAGLMTSMTVPADLAEELSA